MVVDREVSDETHRILEEELDGYEPRQVDENVDAWLDSVPPGHEPVRREAETDGDS